MRPPDFITFTGVDQWTDPQDMKDLSWDYPVEWGILFSQKRQGMDPRYPDPATQWVIAQSGLRLSAHICGASSRAIMGEDSAFVMIPNHKAYKRFQINHREPDPERIARFAEKVRVRCIAQTRDTTFPEDNRIDWLFDRSGGRGEAPDTWPPHPGNGRRVGYAGGIGPDNVVGVLAEIVPKGPYWIDMESGVRTDDRLDIEKCREVCRRVFG